MNAPNTSLLPWLLLLAGCATPGYEPPAPEPTEPVHPAWSGSPTSWEKLGDIEEWLQGDGPARAPEYVPEAELALAEGRLELAERERATIPQPVFDVRVGAAESGFRQTLTRSDLAPSQRLRAERGITRVRELRAGAVPTKAPATAALAVEPRASWRAQSPARARLTRASGPWTRITVHHSAEPSSQLGRCTSAEVSGALRDIQSVHMRDEGWGDIGYHFLIDPTGKVWQGRALDWQGAHAYGSNNVGNIGICLLGNFVQERPDPRALRSLGELTDALCARHSISRTRIYGHRQLHPTVCPGDPLMAWVTRYASGASR